MITLADLKGKHLEYRGTAAYFMRKFTETNNIFSFADSQRYSKAADKLAREIRETELRAGITGCVEVK